MRTLTSFAYPDKLEFLIGRRLRSWFDCPTPRNMRARWDLVREILCRAPPCVRWPYLKTISGGWTTTDRMHVTDTLWSCVFGCSHPDCIAHYLKCPRLTYLVCRPRAVVSQCPPLRLKLGLPVQYPAFDLTRENAILATALYIPRCQGNGLPSRRAPFNSAPAARCPQSGIRQDAQQLLDSFASAWIG